MKLLNYMPRITVSMATIRQLDDIKRHLKNQSEPNFEGSVVISTPEIDDASELYIATVL